MICLLLIVKLTYLIIFETYIKATFSSFRNKLDLCSFSNILFFCYLKFETKIAYYLLTTDIYRFLMTSLRLLFLICLATLSVLAQQETRKLIYVQELFRHGARYPIYPKSNDGSNISIIDNSLG